MRIEEVSKQEAEVEIINSIKSKYKSLRQKSKAPTFALTYSGTYRTLMVNCGFDESTARQIESKYHELYKESDEWVAKKVNEGARKGYITVAFGLRVRCPVMHQCILGLKNTPKEAEAEKRTAGNAMGQSYGLLNSRAGIEFNQKVRESEHRLNIRPIAQIHDAQYFMIKDDLDTLLWANKELVKAVSWQDDPNIYHPTVKLGGEFSIFFPDWAHECVIPNGASSDKFVEVAKEFKHSLKE